VLSRHVLASRACSASELVPYEKGKHFGVLADYEYPIRFSDAGLFSEAQKGYGTWGEMLKVLGEQCPADEVILAVERPLPKPESPGVAPSLPWKDWTKWTNATFYRDICMAAKAFMTLGVEKFGSVAVMGYNAPEWVISAYAALSCGAKFAGIYLTDTPDQIQYKVSHSGSAVVVLDSKVEFDAVASKIEELPGVKAIVVWGMQAPGDLRRADGSLCEVLQWDQMLALGGARGSDAALQTRLGEQRGGHCMCLVYTSGTTGFPKAVMICHENYMAQGRTVFSQLGSRMNPEHNRIISFLPLSHVAASLFDCMVPVYGRVAAGLKHTVYFTRPYDLKEMTLAQRIGFVEPTAFFAVPRVYEKIQERMMAVGATITGVKKTIATWAKGKGLEYCRNLQAGGSGAKPFLHGVADKLILSKAREALGLHKCGIFITGAAPMSIDTFEYFGQLGIIILNVFGMSESSGGATINTWSTNLYGTCGATLPGVETACFQIGPNGEKVEAKRSTPGKKPSEDEQGEICMRGRHVMMGYLANPSFGADHVAEIEKKTREAIDDEGWLHSGDKGTIDTSGFMSITGRYKELIIGAGGENIAPVPVETDWKQNCPALSNVMMVGEKRKYNVALVSLIAEGATGELPGTDNLAGLALAVNPKVKTISEAMKDPVWQQYIQQGLDKTNANPLACQNNAFKIQRFAILPRDFSVETGEFTPTLKLKRSVAADIWKDLIETMY
jgi:long-chain-fatty-acid--CoA ligase ACSBG